MLGEGAVRSLFRGLVAVNLLFLFLPVSIAAFLCLCVPYHPFIVSFLLSNLHTHMHTHTQTLTHTHTHQPWGVDLDHSLLPREKLSLCASAPLGGQLRPAHTRPLLGLPKRQGWAWQLVMEGRLERKEQRLFYVLVTTEFSAFYFIRLFSYKASHPDLN